MQEGASRSYAGFWIRVPASLIDSLLLLGATLLVSGLGFGVFFFLMRVLGQVPEGAGFFDIVTPADVQMLQGLTNIVLSAAYFIYAHYKFGTTFGKRLFGITVVSAVSTEKAQSALTLKQSALRYVGTLVSALTLGAGYVLVAFHPKKQGLHDLIASTLSVRRDT